MLARIVIEVLQTDFVFTTRCFGLEQIEVNCVVIRQSHELLVNALVFHDLR